MCRSVPLPAAPAAAAAAAAGMLPLMPAPALRRQPVQLQLCRRIQRQEGRALSMNWAASAKATTRAASRARLRNGSGRWASTTRKSQMNRRADTVPHQQRQLAAGPAPLAQARLSSDRQLQKTRAVWGRCAPHRYRELLLAVPPLLLLALNEAGHRDESFAWDL